MNRQLLLTIALFAMCVSAEAQKPDTARVLIHYKYTWIRDTTNRVSSYTENMVLYVGQRAGAYRSYDGVVYKMQFKKVYADAVAASPDGNVRINRRGVGSNIEYYQYPNERKLLTKDQLLMNSYLIDGPMPAISWKISNDTATFGGLHCQQATSHFKGRDYIAWFCPDLPLHIGPWKLNGLPGVIVDAHDTKNQVVFKFDGVEKAVITEIKPIVGANVAAKDVPPILRDLDDDPNLIEPPARVIKTTQKEFDRLGEAMQKDPNGFVQANNAGNGPQADHIMVKAGPRLAGPVINNPIELPEKK